MCNSSVTDTCELSNREFKSAVLGKLNKFQNNTKKLKSYPINTINYNDFEISSRNSGAETLK